METRQNKSKDTLIERLLTAEDLAKTLGVSASTIYRKRSKGEDLPPAIRLGTLVRWDITDVQTWIDSKREGAS